MIPSVAHTIVSDVREMKNLSNKGFRYVVTFVDKKSRLVRVNFVRKNSEVAEKTKNFMRWVRNQRVEGRRVVKDDAKLQIIPRKS